MERASHGITLVISEDDDDDFMLIEKSLDNLGFKPHQIRRFTNGETLLNYLLSTIYQDESVQDSNNPKSMLIFMDLNMPKKDGRQALKEIKSHPVLRRIPVVVFTTSPAPADVIQAYDLGANAYVQKPVHFHQFDEVLRSLTQHWVKTICLPPV